MNLFLPFFFSFHCPFAKILVVYISTYIYIYIYIYITTQTKLKRKPTPSIRNKAFDYLLKCPKSKLVVSPMNFLSVVNGTTKIWELLCFTAHKALFPLISQRYIYIYREREREKDFVFPNLPFCWIGSSQPHLGNQIQFQHHLNSNPIFFLLSLFTISLVYE